MHRAWILLIVIEEGFALAQKIRETQNEDGPPAKSEQCGIWTKTISGGQFMSPNYPNTYPPNKECVYVLEALPRQRIQLVFDKNYYIEPSFECRFDHLEIRDGPFGFSPLIDRYCGPKSPGVVTSTGRFMWIKFTSDEELEGLGFRVKYTYIADPDFKLHVGGLLNPIPDCQFDISGSDGFVRSSQVEEEEKVKPGEALDCIWTIRAPPHSKIYLRFLEYQMENSNECKRNFVAIYDGSSAIENLKAKFCSTVANDVMLDNGVGVVRMWADETSRLSRFRMLFTSFVDQDDATKAKSSLCHTGTQAPEEINEQPAVPHKHQELKIMSPALGSSPAVTEDVPVPKSQRRPKEVTLKSREPGRVQAFAPESSSESEVPEVSKDHKVLPAETVSMTTAAQLHSKTNRAPEQMEISAVAVPPSEDSLIKKEEAKEKREYEQKTKDAPKAESGHAAKPNLPITENLEQKQTAGLETPQLREAECEPKPEPLTQKTNTETADGVLEKPKPAQNKSEPSKRVEAMTSAPQSEANSKSAGLDLQFPIIDDCPPRPAPFEHRIVSAKQVSIGSCYTVEPNELLGGGRFGQVHKCAELSSGLILAAKIIKVKGMKEREEVKNEIGMMNQLNHVNLIQLYDAFESRTNLTLIMEYVEGGELFDRIVNEHYQLTELDAIVFMRQICEGVQYLHQQYILHLDLKPENILCVSSNSNQIKIIDFGLARKYRPREKLKVNFGTPEFLAPEVVNYDFVSFPTDMWSVGVITYMLLSGLSPFLGENDAETMNNILHANWDFDAEAFENVSEEAKDFISKLLIPAKCSRMSASGCMKHSWLNNLEEKAKRQRVRLKSHMRLQRYLAAHRQWKKHFYAVTAANRLKRFQQHRSINTL